MPSILFRESIVDNDILFRYIVISNTTALYYSVVYRVTRCYNKVKKMLYLKFSFFVIVGYDSKTFYRTLYSNVHSATKVVECK